MQMKFSSQIFSVECNLLTEMCIKTRDLGPVHVQLTKIKCRLKVNCKIYKNILQFNLSKRAKRMKFRQNGVLMTP